MVRPVQPERYLLRFCARGYAWGKIIVRLGVYGIKFNEARFVENEDR